MNDTLSWLREYQSLTAGVGLANMPGRSQVELRGRDRVRFLHSFCTNDIERLTPGGGCEAFVTNHQGKTVGHVWVFCREEALELDSVAGQAAGLIAHFDRFVISDDVTFRDLTDSTGELLLAGPHAQKLLGELAGSDVPADLWRNTTAKLAGRDVQIRRVDFLLPASYVAVVPPEGLADVEAALAGAGAIRCGVESIEAVRLESGMPLFGQDITEDNFPQEIRRDSQAISFTKGCYLGQETVARIDGMGHVNRFLTGVRFLAHHAAIPPSGSELSVGGKTVGHVTSAAWSPRLQQPLALALLRRAHASPGTKLDSPAGPAEVVTLPLAP